VAVRALTDRLSPCVLRVRPDSPATGWWHAVRLRRDVPGAILVLAHGRSRVELTRDEAERALQWAAGLDGWAAAEPKPLQLYPDGA
jgi:hypothetical protein